MWESTIDAMSLQPGADLPMLEELRTWVTHGIRLTFDTPSPPAEYDNTYAVLQNMDAVRTRLQEYINFGAVVRLPDNHPLPRGIKPLHAIIKLGKKARLVIDLARNLNPYLRHEELSYSSVLDAVEQSEEGCWYGKLDLSNCFLSFPLHPSEYEHFVFRFEGVLYQFVRMPFGLSSAPAICTRLLSVIAFELECRGISPLTRYLDDFLFIKRTEHTCRWALTEAQSVFHNFGMVVNPEKTEGPAQRLAFLGILMDSINMTISCTAERITELLALLDAPCREEFMKLSTLSTLIGKLSFAAQVLPGARPFMRRMLDLRQHYLERTSRHSRLPQNRHARFTKAQATLRLDAGFKADARHWTRQLHMWNGTQRWRSSRLAPICFASDASLEGFGFYIESTPADIDTRAWPPHLRVGAGFSGSYAEHHRSLHDRSGQMTWCELFAVFAAMSIYGPWLTHRTVLLYVDNQTDVAIINRQATRSRQLAGLLRQLYSLTVQHNIHMEAVHRKGEDNVLADFLSRPKLHLHNHVEQWQRTHPSLSHALLSVSLVSSQEFVSEQAKPQ
jgi:hypothetical protein